MEEFKIIKNPNKEYFVEISQKVKDNDNYCPCSLLKNEDTKCICKAFRESTTLGFCSCGLYEKVEL